MEFEYVDVRCAVGESPVWHAAEQAWYWVDIPARRIWRLDYASRGLANWQAAEMVACIAPRASGGLIAGMETGIFGLDLLEDGTVRAEKLAAPSAAELTAGMRFNDGRTDRQGRFWAGTMWMDMAAAKPLGRLYSYTRDAGLSRPLEAGLITQNGLAWSPDGRTMYLSDSHPTRRIVWAYDYDVDAGVPHDRRVFADMSGFVGRPDGAAIDVDGCYWVAGNDGGSLLRFTPAGKLDRELKLPFPKPSMPCFGGPQLDTLLVTSIPGPGQQDDPRAGAVVLVRPGVQGVLEAPFAA
jgi:sugar lactone lactonase YvrE